MEKSFWNADTTSTTAARKTIAKLAMPARRAVSPNLPQPGPLLTSAKMPARKEYALRASASRSAKLPICDMGGVLARIFSETNYRSNHEVWKPRICRACRVQNLDIACSFPAACGALLRRPDEGVRAYVCIAGTF